MRYLKSILLVFSFFSLTGNAQSPTYLSLPSLFADHMVLQQNTEAKIWGWAQPGTSVKIVGSWNLKDTVTVDVNDMGKWETTISTAGAGGPYTLELKGNANKVVLNDVMLGEVWLCSGQSNMEWRIKNGVENQKEEINKAKNYDIRYFSLSKRGSSQFQDDCNAKWEICSPTVMSQRSAVAYFFANTLQKSLETPIGVIISAWGGTRGEVWMPKSLVEENALLKASSKKAEPKPWWPVKPGVLYNSMIHPLMPLKMAGVIWYQGESNVNEPETYCLLMQKLIESWRKGFKQDLPFYIVQIAPFNYGQKDNGAALIREAQQEVIENVEGTALIGTNDVGDVNNIHPHKKKQVGVRLANVALKDIYRLPLKEVHNPRISNFEINKDKVILNCEHVGDGLVMLGKEAIGLTIAGEDGVFEPAKIKIKKNIIHVYSSKIKRPVKVRYCFDKASIGNIFNSEGLPLLPYRSDK